MASRREALRAYLKAGVKGRCISQYESAPSSSHHRMAQRFLDPSHPHSLRAAIDDMRPDGTGMSPTLLVAVQSLAWVPLDDCICEGPHAKAKKIKLPASNAKWTWVASSMRLAQNIEDCYLLPERLGCSIRAVWSSYSTVVQPPSKATKVPRCRPLDFQKCLNRLDHIVGFQVGKQRQLGSCGGELGRGGPRRGVALSCRRGLWEWTMRNSPHIPASDQCSG